MNLSQISIQPVFRQRPEMKNSLIPVLVKNKRITPDIILQYCRSFALALSAPSIYLLPVGTIQYTNVHQYVECSVCALTMLKIVYFICSAFGLDRDSIINQYITTLLLLQEDEEDVGDLGGGLKELQPLCHADALERVLQIIPMLHSTSELTSSLSAAIYKVCE